MLDDGSQSSNGRVLVCVSGQWHGVCDDESNSWDEADTQVVCRQSGYLSTSSE